MTEGVHILFHFNILLLTQREALYQDYQNRV